MFDTLHHDVTRDSDRLLYTTLFLPVLPHMRTLYGNESNVLMIAGKFSEDKWHMAFGTDRLSLFLNGKPLDYNFTNQEVINFVEDYLNTSCRIPDRVWRPAQRFLNKAKLCEEAQAEPPMWSRFLPQRAATPGVQ